MEYGLDSGGVFCFQIKCLPFFGTCFISLFFVMPRLEERRRESSCQSISPSLLPFVSLMQCRFSTNFQNVVGLRFLELYQGNWMGTEYLGVMPIFLKFLMSKEVFQCF